MLVYHLRHACRLLVRERGFTSAAVLTLALGVGANVAVFAVVEAVLLRPLPYPNANALVTLNHRDERTGITKEFIAIGDHVDLEARQSSFDAFGAYGGRRATIFNLGDPFSVSALLATSGVFDALSVRPVLGRALRPDDSRPGTAPVALLGYELWQQRFGADQQVVGRGVRIGTEDYQVVGVAPQGFHFPPDSPTDLILPLSIPAQAPAARKSSWTFGLARLRRGVSLDQATANLLAISRQLEQEHPRENQASRYFALPIRDALVGRSSKRALLRQGAAIVAVGTVLGLGAGLAAARSLGALLYGTSPSDPVTLTIAAATLVATIMTACYLPARRAARVDPARTLAEP